MIGKYAGSTESAHSVDKENHFESHCYNSRKPNTEMLIVAFKLTIQTHKKEHNPRQQLPAT
jgi:hypothetical protein